MATEDHDLEEVRHASWFDQGRLKRFELPLVQKRGGRWEEFSLGAEVEPLTREAAEFLSNQGSDLLAQYLREKLPAGRNIRQRVRETFHTFVCAARIDLMDPLDPGLHRMATPLYQHALAERDAVNEKLLQRGKDLDRAGFDAQVKVTSRSTLLFYLGDGVRQVITASNGKFQAAIKAGRAMNLFT